jgi:phenylalanyl-tRNA synthetase alpha chain
MDLQRSIQEIEEKLDLDLSHVKVGQDLETIHVKFLGKKGLIHGLMDLLKNASPEDRPELGKKINELKVKVTSLIEKRSAQIALDELHLRLGQEKIDVTLPGRCKTLGRRHVLIKMLDEMVDILRGMGFSVQIGPEIDTDYYNFEALNFAKDHPARDMQDTFYITSEWLLRTQTSNVQVRVMSGSTPPMRFVTAGKCYRNEDISARSHVMLHQNEGEYNDKDVTFSDLLSTIEEYLTKFFKKELKLRFRPSYFPFVEPGLEVDVSCFICMGKGCPVCKKTGWLELMGAGMIHPEVMKNGGIDPENFSGFAWGMGIERLAMMRFAIEDIRLFTENNLKFLSQF